MSDDRNGAVIGALERLLASSYVLYTKSHNYHWNVTGPMFTTLHTLFELQYTELATAIDGIAERIRALGAYAPGSFTAFAERSVVAEENGHPDAKAMIANLVADHEALSRLAGELIDAAEQAGDAASVDLGTRRQDVHQKQAWMLRSHLE